MADRVENNIVNSLNKAFSDIKLPDTSEKMLSLNLMKNSIVDSELEEEKEVFIDMKKKEESKEATGASSAGSYVGPAFMSTDVKDTETKTKTKPQGGEVGEEKIPGGLSKGHTLMDLAKKHSKDKKTKIQSPERIEKMFNHLEHQLTKGIKIEMEHTDSKKIAKEIAMDHLFEDPNYYNKLAKIEKIEASEATSTSSSGQYSQPAFLAKNAKNWRASKKTQIPGGKFVAVKKKCSTYPYCNQGDINSIDMWESKMVQDALTNVSKNTGLSESYIKSLVETELKKKTLNEQPQGEEPNYVEIIFKNDDSPKFDDLVTDKKSKFLRSKFKGKKVEFSFRDLEGTVEIIDIGPADKGIGFMASPEDFNFDKGTDVQILYKLLELKFEGEKVPLKFYNYISQYIPEDDDEYSTDPVEDAVLFGLDEINSVIKYLGLNLEKVNRNIY
jgi:hypothetical protein